MEEFVDTWDPETSDTMLLPHRSCCVCGRLDTNIDLNQARLIVVYDPEEQERVERMVCSTTCRDMLVLSQMRLK
jgi:predicted nucleic acid-binding Zn ribbon protein